MNLDRVTITGADDSIHPTALLPLTKEFPFVEWGILASDNNTLRTGGTPRYPSPQWIADLQGLAETTGAIPRLALHINGKWVRALLMGQNEIPMTLWHCFARVQLNFHAERNECRPDLFATLLNDIGKDFIFQVDGVEGNRWLEEAQAHEAGNCYALFDVSGGAGILPSEWPRPLYLDMQPGEHGCGEEYWAYHGYAGGLGPDNLAEQIPRIAAACAATKHTREGRIWIDMETHVRSDGDRLFDLSKVRRCLEICAPFVSKEKVLA